MTHPALAELLSYTQKQTGPAVGRQGGFVAAYFENTDPDEIAARDPATLFAIANAHWRLLEKSRSVNSARVRVFNPTLAEDGFSSEHTVVQIVHENMPFLVDSVTMAINRSGRTAHWIVHPMLSVARDAAGAVSEVSRFVIAAENSQKSPVESLILVECDRILRVEDVRALAADLERVLGDVRDAVQDWSAILDRLRTAGLSSSRSKLSDESRQEGQRFVAWLQDRNFTFLGARNYDLKRDENGVSLVACEGSGLGILRGEVRTVESRLPVEAHSLLESDDLVLVTKAMTRATVHQPAWLDCIAVKQKTIRTQGCHFSWIGRVASG